MKLIQTLGLIGDVHAQHGALHVALDHLQGLHLDQLACVGDIVDGRGDVDECCRLLSEASVVTVRGNHERWLLAGSSRDLPGATQFTDLAASSIRYLSSLSPTVDLATVNGRAQLCHGLGANDMALLKPHDEGYAIESNTDLWKLTETEPRLAYVLCGHSHWRMVRSFGHLTVINAGTLLPDRAGFCTIDFEDETATFYEFDAELQVTTAAQVPLLGPDWPE